jgi:hypothetical protein
MVHLIERRAGEPCGKSRGGSSRKEPEADSSSTSCFSGRRVEAGNKLKSPHLQLRDVATAESQVGRVRVIYPSPPWSRSVEVDGGVWAAECCVTTVGRHQERQKRDLPILSLVVCAPFSGADTRGQSETSLVRFERPGQAPSVGARGPSLFELAGTASAPRRRVIASGNRPRREVDFRHTRVLVAFAS